MRKRISFAVLGSLAVISLCTVAVTAASASNAATPQLSSDKSFELLGDSTNPDEMFPDYAGPTGDFFIALEPVVVEYADVFAGQSLEHEPPVAVVGYFAQSDRGSDFASHVKEIATHFDIDIRIEKRDFSLAEREDLMIAIHDNPKQWRDFFGTNVTSLDVNDVTGVLEVTVPSDQAARVGEELTSKDGTPFLIVGSGKVSVDFPSRTADSSPR